MRSKRSRKKLINRPTIYRARGISRFRTRRSHSPRESINIGIMIVDTLIASRMSAIRRNLERKHDTLSTCRLVLSAEPIYISSTQAVVRQMRAQIGRSVSPSRGSPATYVQLRPISSDLEKCRARSWQSVCRARACRSRSAIYHRQVVLRNRTSSCAIQKRSHARDEKEDS